jgi:hypothetical protein
VTCRSAASVGHQFSCERRKSRAAVLSQAGAPLSWTIERADTSFVCEGVRKAAATSASLSERSEQYTQRAERAIHREGSRGVFPLRATTK